MQPSPGPYQDFLFHVAHFSLSLLHTPRLQMVSDGPLNPNPTWVNVNKPLQEISHHGLFQMEKKIGAKVTYFGPHPTWPKVLIWNSIFQ